METADLVLMPWIEARRRLGSREHRLRVLTPPYPALGGGELRVLRVRLAGRGSYRGLQVHWRCLRSQRGHGSWRGDLTLRHACSLRWRFPTK